jgi:F-type H+-transporting ATPase subunit epsilon
MSQNIPGSLHLKVITPRRLLCDAEAEAVFLPSLEGQIGILPGHKPMMVALGQGILTCKLRAETESHAIRGGYAEITPDRVLVFTEAGN